MLDSQIIVGNLPNPCYGPPQATKDTLPIFATLTSDEDRETKAELHKPGTFIVVATPTSFIGLPEYRGDGFNTSHSAPSSPVSRSKSMEQYNTREMEHGPPDPNIRILERFEEAQRSLVSPTRKFGPSMEILSSEPAIDNKPASSLDESSLPKLDNARHEDRKEHLLQHYRSCISPELMKTAGQSGSEDIFELQARTFPPVDLTLLDR
jgi:hypothetical protein